MAMNQALATLSVSPILPIASAWIAFQERRILKCGAPLTAEGMADARELGIVHPERVRLLRVEKVPLPGSLLSDLVGRLIGAHWNHTIGLTARYGIFIRAPFWGDRRLLAHELVHTGQYERLGGIRPFLRQYLLECLTAGYNGAPLEVEATKGAARLCS